MRGLREQASAQGYTARLLPVDSADSPYNKWRVWPKPLAGGQRDAYTEGALLRCELSLLDAAEDEASGWLLFSTDREINAVPLPVEEPRIDPVP